MEINYITQNRLNAGEQKSGFDVTGFGRGENNTNADYAIALVDEIERGNHVQRSLYTEDLAPIGAIAVSKCGAPKRKRSRGKREMFGADC